jgi:hypothetical protein
MCSSNFSSELIYDVRYNHLLNNIPINFLMISGYWALKRVPDLCLIRNIK